MEKENFKQLTPTEITNLKRIIGLSLMVVLEQFDDDFSENYKRKLEMIP